MEEENKELKENISLEEKVANDNDYLKVVDKSCTTMYITNEEKIKMGLLIEDMYDKDNCSNRREPIISDTENVCIPLDYIEKSIKLLKKYKYKPKYVILKVKKNHPVIIDYLRSVPVEEKDLDDFILRTIIAPRVSFEVLEKKEVV